MTTDPTETLRQLLRERLTPLVTGDYVLLDCPYHANIGDTLIWEGELAFLSGLPRRMLAYGSMSTWLFPRLKPGTVILLHGGGNFGDLWPGVQDFRLKVIETYPDHPIVIFPQTVHYRDSQRLRDDARRMAAHKRLTICVRDRRSFDLLTEHFRNPVLLLPDMAFCIPPEQLTRYRDPHGGDAPLWLKRTDRELASGERPAEVPAGAVQRDWPTLERKTRATWLVYKLSGACDLLGRGGKRGPIRRMLARLADAVAFGSLRTENIRTGVRFLTSYGPVYTTRLHGAILAVLLHKEKVVLIDNNYGKNSSFYEAWLRDVPSIRLAERADESSEK